MGSAIQILQISVSIILVMIILMQVRDSGAGLFGSSSTTFRVRRGVEKVLFQLTIFLSAVFVVVSILSVRLS